MSNYDKYLKILNGAKSKQHPNHSLDHQHSPLRMHGSPLRTNNHDINRNRDTATLGPSTKYDFSRVEMPFNFLSLN